MTFLASTDPVKLFSSIAGGARHPKEGAPSSLSEVRGASRALVSALRDSRSRLSAWLPSCSQRLPVACLFTVSPTVCQSQFLTSHLKLDPNFETRSAPAPLGSFGSSSESLPARKGWRDGSQGSQVFGAGTRLAGLSSIHPAAGDRPRSARGAQRRARGRAPPAAPGRGAAHGARASSRLSRVPRHPAGE